MKILVMGTGGVGGFFGGKLANAGYDVRFIARGKHLEAMKKDGLKIISETEILRSTLLMQVTNPKILTNLI